MPAAPLPEDAVKALVEAATAAPSRRNAQPWRFRFFPGSRTFQLRSAPERAVPHTGPGARALHLGCGAALLNLRVAAVHAGWEPDTQLLPEAAEDPHLLATVRLTGPAAADNGLAALYSAIRRRHTGRPPPRGKGIPAAVRDVLRDAADTEGAQLHFPDAWHVATLLDLASDAERRGDADAEAAGDEVPEDVVSWTRAGEGPGGGAPANLESTPRLALLGTARDRPEDWLRAGQATERVLLRATLDGLATALTTRALEWPDLRQLMRDPQSAMGHVQMMLRLGYGPAGPATPRRPVHEVLDIAR